jgi:hypothetical protein
MLGKAILKGTKVVPVETVEEWANFFENKDRKIGNTRIGEVLVSTVFLGLDHSFFAGPPLWFETMIFGGDRDQETYRYETWEQACAGHRETVASLGGQTAEAEPITFLRDLREI